MLHARRQSTAELQQQHVDRLNRHTIHTTSAGMAHANGPAARATVNSTSWWWGQEQRVVLNFVDSEHSPVTGENVKTSLKKKLKASRPSEHPPARAGGECQQV